MSDILGTWNTTGVVNHVRQLRIGFMGTQSVGKTTLLNALKSEKNLGDFKFLDQLTRQVKEEGFKINEAGDDNTQLQIARKHAENIILYRNFITDRTMLDCIAYTEYLYRRKRVSDITMAKIERYADFLLEYYDVVFYLPIEFDNVADGIRSEDPEFRKEIDDIMNDGYFKSSWLSQVEHYTLTGSVVDRVNSVKSIINTKQYSARGLINYGH